MLLGITDLSTEALQAAIRGLDTRASAIKNNIANVETPGYQAREVDFEDSLRDALDAGDPSQTAPSVTASLAPTRTNGNNVAIDEQLTKMTETELRHSLAINALNAKYRLLRTAITGQ